MSSDQEYAIYTDGKGKFRNPVSGKAEKVPRTIFGIGVNPEEAIEDALEWLVEDGSQQPLIGFFRFAEIDSSTYDLLEDDAILPFKIDGNRLILGGEE